MRFWLVFFLIGSSLGLTAQDEREAPPDSTAILSDSIMIRKGKKVINIETYAQRFNPRKALFYAAILPGAGQVYNKKYWKVPLVYGGFVGLIMVVKFYNDAEIKYSNELFTTISAGATQSVQGHTVDALRTIVDQARRQRDYFTIFTGFFYILQMIDAHVDAHLKEFDLNPRLRVRVEPSLKSNYYVGATYGVALTFKF